MTKKAKTLRRRRYLVDRKLQLALTVPLLLVIAGIGVLYAAAVYFLPGQAALEELTAEQTREVLLKANVLYFLLAMTLVAVVAILITHRVAGPLQVVERAIHGLREGSYDERLSLRRSDYLKTLASAVAGLRSDLAAREAARRSQLDDLERCLREADLDAARELVAQLKGSVSSAAEAADPAPAAPTPASS